MKLQTLKQSIQHTQPAGMSAYWSIACAPVMFSNSNTNLDRGTEIKSRVREGWDD